MDVNGIALIAGAGKYPSTFLNRTHHQSRSIPQLTSQLTGSGIGRQVALAMASRGMNTIVCADLNLESARSTAHECMARKASSAPKFEAHALQFDVTDEASVQHMVDETNRRFGRIDHFVNTAGVSQEMHVSSA